MNFEACKIENEIISIINNDVVSRAKRRAKIGKDYYNARHDILDYRLFYWSADGVLIEDTSRSNIKISHAFYTELIDQKTSYLLSGFKVYSNDEFLNKELEFYFDDEFKAELAEVVENTSKIGFSYMYAQFGKDFRTHFKFADGLGIIEVINPVTEETEYIVNHYIKRFDLEEFKNVIAVEVYDKTHVYYYLIKNNKLMIDPTKEINPRPHKLWVRTEVASGKSQLKGAGFDFIPFFRLDNNEESSSDLTPIKGLIDDYDLMSCGLSNNLQDVSEGIYVIRGFQGTDFNELQQNIKTKKIVGVGEQGDLDIKTINIPYDARKAKLEMDEKNIYRFGMGFNSAQVGDGNVTNVVIKSRYALLDLKCDKLERRIKAFLKPVIDIVLNEINQNLGTNYQAQNVILEFTREVITNSVDNVQIEKTQAETRQIQINTLLNAAGRLSDEIILEEICKILEVDFEEARKFLDNKKSEDKELFTLEEDIENLNNVKVEEEAEENPEEEAAAESPEEETGQKPKKAKTAQDPDEEEAEPGPDDEEEEEDPKKKKRKKAPKKAGGDSS